MAKPKPGKYAAVIDKLPKLLGAKLLGDDLNYQEKVQAIKQAMCEEPGFLLQASALARQYVEARLEKDRIKEDLADVNLRLEAISQLMTDQFEVEGTSSLKLESGHSVSIFLQPYASVMDKDAFREWCVSQQLDRQMVLPWQTLNKLTNDMLLAGEPEPPGVKIFAKAEIRMGTK